MTSQDDKASFFKSSNTKRGNNTSMVKNPIPKPKRYTVKTSQNKPSTIRKNK